MGGNGNDRRGREGVITMTIYKLFALGQTSLTDKLISKGYGSTNGGTCERCHKPLKRYPFFNMHVCGVCYEPEKEGVK